jgi:hypothetical protein
MADRLVSEALYLSDPDGLGLRRTTSARSSPCAFRTAAWYGLLGAQPDDALVLLERSGQIADLQMDGTQRSGVGSWKAGGAPPYGRVLVPVFTTTSPCLLRPCVHSSSALALRIRGRPATTSRT